MKYKILFLFLMIKAYSQNKYVIDNISDKFYFEITGKLIKNSFSCGKNEMDDCKIKIFNKKDKKFLQEVISDVFMFDLKNNKVCINKVQLDNCNPIIFYDFNFDGMNDLAIRNGDNYQQGPNYDFYFYNNKNKKFLKNQQLSSICIEGSGLFKIDSNKKKIKLNDGGFQYNSTSIYEFNTKSNEFKKIIQIDVMASGEKIKYIEKHFKDKKKSKLLFFKSDDVNYDKIQKKIDKIW